MPGNSIVISPEQQDAYRLDAQLKHNAQTVIGGIVEIGRCLKEINDRRLYELLGFNSLAQYSEAAVGLKERAAYNYITAFETYGSEGLTKYGQIGITKLVALAQLSEGERAEMLESGKAEELSTRELKEEIKKLKGENDQLRFQLDDITEGVEKQDGELSDKDAEIADLKRQLEDARRPVVASMTDEEKEEIRRGIEQELKAKYDKDTKIMREKLKLAEKDSKHQFNESMIKENEINRLTAELELEKSENVRLRADAKTPPPVPTGNKELLKYHFEALKTAYVGAVEVLESFDANEREKYKTALLTIAGDIKSAVENM